MREPEMREHQQITVLHPGVEPPAVEPAEPKAGPSRPLNGAPGSLSKRLATLRGARVALLDNNKVNARELLAAFVDGLRSACGIGEVRTWRKPTSAAPAPFVDEIQQWRPDLLLCASGD